MVAEFDVFRDADLFGAQAGIDPDSFQVVDVDVIFQRIADRLASLHECVGNELGEQCFILDVVCAGRKWVQANNGRHHRRRRVEGGFVDIEQGFNIQMTAEHDAESTVGFTTGAGCHAVDDFFLQHEMHIENTVAVVE